MLTKFIKFKTMEIEINALMEEKYDMGKDFEREFVLYNKDRMAETRHAEALKASEEYEMVMESLGFSFIQQDENSIFYAQDVNEELSLETEFYYDKGTKEAYIQLNVEMNGNVIKELDMSEKDLVGTILNIKNNW